jgi:hypothetical protein
VIFLAARYENSVIALRMSAACVERRGFRVTGPHELRLVPGDVRLIAAPDRYHAAVTARLCAGLIKATAGTVTIGDFDPVLQPAQVKRLVAFIPSDDDAQAGIPFARQVDLCAALWDVERTTARRLACEHRRELAIDSPAALAFAALVNRPVLLIVLDRPRAELITYARHLAADGPAVVATTLHRSTDTQGQALSAQGRRAIVAGRVR